MESGHSTKNPIEPDPSLFRRAADSSLDGLGIADSDGRIVYVNAARAAMHGYIPEELIGRDIGSLTVTDPELGPDVGLVRKVGHWEGEAVGVRKDGSQFPVRQMITRVEDENGNHTGFLSVTRDITEERRALTAIEDAERRYRNIVENAIVGVFRSTIDGQVIYANDAMAELMDAGTRETLMARNAWDCYEHPDERRALLQMLREQGAVKSAEVAFKTLTGRKKTALVSMRTEDGTLTGVIVDITQKKAYEDALKRRTTQLTELLDASREIDSLLDTAEVLRSLVRHGMRLVSARCGTAGVLIEDKMVFREYQQEGETFPIDYAFHAGYGVPGHVIEHRAPYVSNDATSDPQVIRSVQKALGFERLVNVPIISADNRLLGCFELHNKMQDRPFTPEDVEMLTGLANHAAVAMVNAALAEDIREKADTLARNEENLRLVVEGSPDFFFYLHDTSGVFTYLSTTVEKITGHSVEEWKSHYTRFFTDNPINQKAVRLTEDAMSAGVAHESYAVEVYHKNGSRIILDVYERPIIEDGQVTGVRGIARDVTEQRRREAFENNLREESERHMRRFYRETIMAVTGGKLIIADPEEVEAMCSDPLFPPIDITSAEDIPMARQEVRRTAEKVGMEESQVDCLLLAVGEAATNAFKHAMSGQICVSDLGDSISVKISDRGSGMNSLSLPMFTLMKGFSSTRSLGMGYAAILASSDKVYLSTGPQGTTVVIEVEKTSKAATLELAKLPDLW